MSLSRMVIGGIHTPPPKRGSGLSPMLTPLYCAIVPVPRRWNEKPEGSNRDCSFATDINDVSTSNLNRILFDIT